MKKSTLKQLAAIYSRTYTALYNGDPVETYGATPKSFDILIATDSTFKQFAQAFVEYRKDLIISDREAVSFAIAYKQVNPFNLPIECF